jgi:hexosaminidase
MKVDEGAFTVTAQIPVVADEASQFAARFLIEQTNKVGGPLLALATARPPGPTIELAVDAKAPIANVEGYELTVSAGGVRILASDARGAFYGAVTLWQLLTSAEPAREVSIPHVQIADAPRFAWRGLMLDSARHYQSPEFIRKFIDTMALHKLNVLHWHLTDDQGWRLEIKKYPRLTEVGAWRVPAGRAAQADIDAADGRPRRYGGFYSQETVRELVAYAAERHITIVPEIEMPGHASATVVAYPQLSVDGHAPREVPADWGVYPTLFNVDEATFAFLEDVLTEVMALFPGEYLHVGGDEAVKDLWQASRSVQTRMRALGMADEHALQSYFVQRIGRFLAQHGRRLIGWDEILEGGLASDATVMSWRGLDGATAAAAAGHDTVLSPWPTLYLDNRPLDTATPPGRGRIVGLEEVYRFDPAPPAIPEAQRRHIIGVQANIWTEHIRTEDRVEYMAFPRVAALAEVAWSPASRIDFADFAERLSAQLARYDRLGTRYAHPEQTVLSVNDARRTSHRLALCTDKLLLSLEDDAPIRGERAIFLVDIMNPCWLWKQADLSRGATLSVDVGQLPFNFQIGKDRAAIPLPKPRTAAGELEVRVDACTGPVIASLPLAPAVDNDAVTTLPPTTLSAVDGKHDLCFTFTRNSVDPIWAIDAVTLTPGVGPAVRPESGGQ